MELREILRESLMMEAYEMLLTEGKDPMEVLSRKYEGMDPELIRGVVTVDPTKKKSYSYWVLGVAAANGEEELLRRMLGDGTLSRVFGKLHERADIQLSGFKTLEEMSRILAPACDSVLGRSGDEYEYVENLGREVDSRLANDFDVVYDDGSWLIAVPNTYEAACKLGENMRWCTANAHGNGESYYNRYTGYGKLFVNFDRRGSETGVLRRKEYPYVRYQFNFESKQFMDKDDQDIRNRELGIPEGVTDFYREAGYNVELLHKSPLTDEMKERYRAQRLAVSIPLGGLILMPRFNNDYVFEQPDDSTPYYLFCLYGELADERDPLTPDYMFKRAAIRDCECIVEDKLYMLRAYALYTINPFTASPVLVVLSDECGHRVTENFSRSANGKYYTFIDHHQPDCLFIIRVEGGNMTVDSVRLSGLNSYIKSLEVDNVGSVDMELSDGQRMRYSYGVLEMVNEGVVRRDDKLRESLRRGLLAEAHGVSNGWLSKFKDYVLKVWKGIKGDEVVLEPCDFEDAIVDFPPYYREIMMKSELKVTNYDESYGTGRCMAERNGGGGYLITIYLSKKNKHKDSTAFHELSHMLDLLSGGGVYRGENNRYMSVYTDNLAADKWGEKYRYRENNRVSYGFMDTEMKARLNGFKHMLDKEMREDETVMKRCCRGYKVGFEAYKNFVGYSESWYYAVRAYEERYESVVEKDMYGGGNIEFAREIQPLLNLRGVDMTKGEDEYTEEEREAITAALVGYFRRLISGYKKRLWRVALDVWYDIVEVFRGTCERNGKMDCYRRFMSNKAINGNE